jgi:hypothetical protein
MSHSFIKAPCAATVVSAAPFQRVSQHSGQKLRKKGNPTASAQNGLDEASEPKTKARYQQCMFDMRTGA